MRTGGMPRLILGSLLLHVAAVAAVMHVVSRQAPVPARSAMPVFVEQLTEEGARHGTGKVPPRLTAPAAQRPAMAAAMPAAARPAEAPVHPVPVVRTSPTAAGSRPIAAARPEAPPAEKEGGPATVVRTAGASPVAAGLAAHGSAAPAAGAAPDAGKTRGSINRQGDGSTLPRTSGGAPPAVSGSQARGGYQALLKRLIEARKEYPLASRRRREEGSCQRRLVLARDGSLQKVESVSRCGYPFLDEAATKAITSVGKFPPLPRDIEGAEAAFTVAITFRLATE